MVIRGILHAGDLMTFRDACGIKKTVEIALSKTEIHLRINQCEIRGGVSHLFFLIYSFDFMFARIFTSLDGGLKNAVSQSLCCTCFDYLESYFYSNFMGQLSSHAFTIFFLLQRSFLQV